MARKAAIEVARESIFAAFSVRRPRAYRKAELAALFASNRRRWNLPQGLSLTGFMQFLIDSGKLQHASIESDSGLYDSFPRYLWEGCTPLEVASTLKGGAYLSHGTAAFLHGLTEQVPKTFYVNKEQSPKPQPKGELHQANIARAFKGKQRVSKYIFTYEASRFVLLSGKNTKNYGVLEVEGPSGEPLLITDVERTLVDIAVRPVYGGGVEEVLHIYRAARDSVSVGKILAALRAVGHFYPYHQAIGFYMERAGYKSSQLNRLKALGCELDFYLSHGMVNPEFDESWRVHFPEGF